MAVAPTIFYDQMEPYAGDWSINPPRATDPVELHDATPPARRHDFSQHWLTCERYRDLRDPRQHTPTILRVGTRSAIEFAYPFRRSLFGNSGGSDRGWEVKGIDELLESSEYQVPTLFFSGMYDTKVDSEVVRRLAKTAKHAPTEYVELPVCHDFRASQEEIDRVTGALIDRIGQLLTTRTVKTPKPLNSMLMVGMDNVGLQPEVIVLSTARPDSHREMVEASTEARMPIVALASHKANPAKIAEDMRRVGASGLVVDVPQDWILPMTADFATTNHPAVAARKSNLWSKRNLGLLFGSASDDAAESLVEAVYFTDDDMRRRLKSWLDQVGLQPGQYDIAGFVSRQYPDLSVVYHADLLAGGDPPVSISGNALAVSREAAAHSFHDRDYNEDRKFVYPFVELGSAALVGEIQQLPYDPFADPRRAASEVFGDVFADGLWYLLGAGTSYREVGEDFWRFAMWRYDHFIDDVAGRLMTKLDSGDEQVPRALASLRAAKAQLATYTPADFYTYALAWHDDLEGRWPEAYAKFPQDMTLAEVVAHNGLSVQVVGPSVRHSASGLVY